MARKSKNPTPVSVTSNPSLSAGAALAEPPAAQRKASRAPDTTNRDLLMAGALITFAVLFVFSQVTGFGLVGLDDTTFTVDNVLVTQGLTWNGIQYAFRSIEMGSWHPLTWMSHMVDFSLFGGNVGAHHMENVILHLINAFAIVLLGRILTGHVWPAAIVALLFAVHPMHAEPVAWLADRKGLLSTTFWLISIGAWVAWVRPAGPESRRLWWAVSFLAFGFALLSKPTAVTLPFTLLLVEFWPLRSWKSPGELIGRLPAISPFFALTLVFSVLTYWGQREAGAMAMYGGTGLAERLANAGYGFAMYLWKTLWPAGLALNPPIASPPAAVVALGGMLFAAGSALAVWRAREWPWLFAGWFWFAGTLVPSLGLVQTGEQAFADRYSYVPHIGLFALAVAGAVHLLGAERWKSAPGQAAVAVLLLVLAWRAHGQTSYWRDPITQFEHTVAVSPGHSQGRQVLARSYLRLKRHDAAERHINAAIGANPGDPESHRILAEILFQRGDNEKSLARLTDAERVAPNSALTQFNRGIVLREMGRNEEAAAAYAKAIELGLMPDRRAEAWYSMGLAQNKANQTDRAVASFQKALEIDPYHYFARKNLAFAYMRLQDYAKAQPHFELLLRANETDEDVVRSLQFLRNRR